MSVVDGDWESLKRFNLAELYKSPPKVKAASNDTITSTESEGKPGTAGSGVSNGAKETSTWTTNYRLSHRATINDFKKNFPEIWKRFFLVSNGKTDAFLKLTTDLRMSIDVHRDYPLIRRPVFLLPALASNQLGIVSANSLIFIYSNRPKWRSAFQALSISRLRAFPVPLQSARSSNIKVYLLLSRQIAASHGFEPWIHFNMHWPGCVPGNVACMPNNSIQSAASLPRASLKWAINIGRGAFLPLVSQTLRLWL